VGIAQAFDFIDTRLCPHVPELGNSVVAYTAELSFLYRVEGYLFNPGQMAPEFCRVLELLSFGVPYNTSARLADKKNPSSQC
jgi:hypothetical protein